MHCAPGAAEPQLCLVEAAPAGSRGSAADLRGANGGGSRAAARGVRSKVGCDPPDYQPSMAAQLGADYSVLCLPHRHPEGDLYNQCRRVTEHEPAQNHQDARVISKSGGSSATALSCATESL